MVKFTPSKNEEWNETLVEKRVTYSIEVDGQYVIIRDVPTRVNVETGEKHFSPETVERMQQAVWGNDTAPAVLFLEWNN